MAEQPRSVGPPVPGRLQMVWTRDGLRIQLGEGKVAMVPMGESIRVATEAQAWLQAQVSAFLIAAQSPIVRP